MKKLISFDVSDNRLRGSIPRGLRLATKLQHFLAAGNVLLGSLPDALGSLFQLQRFKVGTDVLHDGNELTGLIPYAVDAWTHVRSVVLCSNRFTGGAPDAMASWTGLTFFDVASNQLSGLPGGVSSWTRLYWLLLSSNALSDPLPDAISSSAKVARVEVDDNRFSGSAVPDAVAAWRELKQFGASYSAWLGPVPGAVGFWTILVRFDVHGCSLTGEIPEAVTSLRTLTVLNMRSNALSGHIPDGVASWQQLMQSLDFRSNRLLGAIPDAVASWGSVRNLLLQKNMLAGAIPDGVARLSRNVGFGVGSNQLSGAIPTAIGHVGHSKGQRVSAFIDVSHNALSGSIPSSVARLGWETAFVAQSNQLSGSIGSVMRFDRIIVNDNRLTGSLPPLTAEVLACSGNMLEGTVRLLKRDDLVSLDISGRPGQVGGLQGPLPTSLSRAKFLLQLLACHQDLQGVLPPLFAATCSMLALHNNRLKVFSGTHLQTDGGSTVLVQNNLLSCHLPSCGAARAKISLAALGNQVYHPNARTWPAWIAPLERASFFWTSNTEGHELLQRIIGGGGIFVVLAASKKHRGPGLLSVLLRWCHARPASHSQLQLVCIQILSFIAKGTLKAMCLLMLLLTPWDTYTCPRTLAAASSCLRSSSTIHMIASLLWVQFCSNARAVQSLMLKPTQRSKTRTSVKLCLSWLLWWFLTSLLSCLSVFSQAGRSVPGILLHEGLWLSGINLGIGAVQGGLTAVVMPTLAAKLTPHKQAFNTVASLLMSCLLPAAVIVALDVKCLGSWVALWKPCRSNPEQFRFVQVCGGEENPCGWWSLTSDLEFRVRILGVEDVCDSRSTRSRASISDCMGSTLLRLQDVWLRKFITTGLAVPTYRLMSGKCYVEPSDVIGELSLIVAFGMLTAGHLPLMMPLLLVNVLSGLLLVAYSLNERALKDWVVVDVASSSLSIARVGSTFVFLATSFGHLGAFLVVIFAGLSSP